MKNVRLDIDLISDELYNLLIKELKTQNDIPDNVCITDIEINANLEID
jgi:hypothetical protein